MSDAPYAIDMLKIAKAGVGGRSRGHLEPMDLPSPPGRRSEDARLLEALRAGDPSASAQFITSVSGPVWTACRLFAGEGEAAREAFSDILSKLCADKFARLRAYNGRGSLNTFVMLVVRELPPSACCGSSCRTASEAGMPSSGFSDPISSG